MPAAFSRASRPRLKSGASTPMKASGGSRQQALGQLRRGCRRSRGSGAAPRHSRAPRACRAATRPRSPARPCCGPPMPSAPQRRPARAQAAEQQAGQQVARGLAGHHREARGLVGHRRASVSGRCRASRRRGSRASARRRRPPRASLRPSAAIAARASSSVRPSRYSSAVHLLDRGDALGAEAAPAQALDVEAAHRERVAVDHHERRHVLRDVALEAGHRVRADLARTGARRSGRRRSPSRRACTWPASVGVVGEDGVVADAGSRARCARRP